jgi:hypothetical protein
MMAAHVSEHGNDTYILLSQEQQINGNFNPNAVNRERPDV